MTPGPAELADPPEQARRGHCGAPRVPAGAAPRRSPRPPLARSHQAANTSKEGKGDQVQRRPGLGHRCACDATAARAEGRAVTLDVLAFLAALPATARPGPGPAPGWPCTGYRAVPLAVLAAPRSHPLRPRPPGKAGRVKPGRPGPQPRRPPGPGDSGPAGPHGPGQDSAASVAASRRGAADASLASARCDPGEAARALVPAIGPPP